MISIKIARAFTIAAAVSASICMTNAKADDYWRVHLKNGQVAVLHIDNYSFVGGTLSKPERGYEGATMPPGYLRLNFCGGFLCGRDITYSELKSFRFENCKGENETSGDMTCDVEIVTANGEKLSRQAKRPSPILYYRKKDDSVNEGLISISGEGFLDGKYSNNLLIQFGWGPINGRNFRYPRTVDAVEVLNIDEARLAFSQEIENLYDSYVKSGFISFRPLLRNIFSPEQRSEAIKRARDYWKKLYLVMTQSLRDGKASPSELSAIAAMVDESNASKWSQVDFDGLAPKAKSEIEEIQKSELRNYVESHKKAIKEEKRLEELEAQRVASFRRGIKVETKTNCGPVIDKKGSLIKVYAALPNFGSEHWLERDQLYPPDYSCWWKNGKYFGINQP